ncbi:putative mariner transposase [Trichonephila clavipes]|nr:putative mariner transposase [Trichonephila clavipes]
MLEEFFDIQGIMHLEFIPEGHIVNKEFVDIQLRLCDSIRKKRPKLWSEKSLLLLHDSTLANQSLLVTDFFPKKKTVLPHPPYSPDLASSDFNLFF